MKRRLGMWFFVWAWAGLSTTFGQEAPVRPEITLCKIPSAGRLMNTVPLRAEAQDPEGRRTVKYEWSINDGTGYAVLTDSSKSTAGLQLWWTNNHQEAKKRLDAGAASGLLGKKVEVQLSVSFVEEPGMTASCSGEVTVTSINHPPVPKIEGRLGIPDARIPTGDAVALWAYSSTDPDGDDYRYDWGLGPSRGGKYLQAPVLYGSEGAAAYFTVPAMTANIDQDVILQLSEGLYEVQTTATVYLTPAGSSPPPAPNVAPTVSVTPPSQTVLQGQPAVFTATANDTNGDALGFTWLLGDTSVSQSYVVTTRTSTTQWKSTLSYPTSGLAPGSYTVSVQAKETQTTEKLASTKQLATLIVSASGGGEPGTVDVTPGSCSPGNSGPQLVSITPDPRQGRLIYSPGQQASIELIFQDSSTKQSPLGGTQTGVGDISWDVSALRSRGVTPSTTPALAMPDPKQAKSTLSFTVPSSATAGTAGIRVTAKDVLDCSTTVTFDVELLSGNPSSPGVPVARIRYGEEGDGTYSGPFESGHTVTTTRRTVYLDAGASEDDEGLENLTFTWSAGGIAGVEVSPANQRQAVLRVPEGATGTVTVTLKVRDSEGNEGTSTIHFTYTTASKPPKAEIVSAPPWVSVGEEFQVVAGATSRGGSGDFRYQWTAKRGDGTEVEVFQAGPRAKIVVPELPAGVLDDVVTVTVTVLEDGLASDPETVEIPLFPALLAFSQVGVGGIDPQRRLETSIVLVNPSGEPAHGFLTFTAMRVGEEEEVPEAWEVLVDGEPASEVAFELEPEGAREFLVTGDDVRAGWMRLIANPRLAGHLFYRVRSTTGAGDDGSVLLEVPILPVQGRSFRTALGPGENANIALALANLGDKQVYFQVAANQQGGASLRTEDIKLEPHGHTALFLQEIFRDHALSMLSPSFKGGTLVVETDGEGAQLAVTVLKTTPEGLPFSILPVAVTP